MFQDEDWRDDAACRHADPELFFPIGTAGPAAVQVDEAKRVCRDCTVRASCLAWAMSTPAVVGIWGGTTENDRRAIRRFARTVEQTGLDTAPPTYQVRPFGSRMY